MNDTDRFPADLFPIESGEMRQLHGKLERILGTDDIDISYRTVDSPVGPLLLAASATGMIRVAFGREGFDRVLESLAETVSPRIVESPRRLDRTAKQLEEYFEGARHDFTVPLDRSLSRGFRATVHEYLPSIGFGATLSYKEVAERVGNPQAVRAVGTACATNPLPIVVPCHRVLRSDGSLGGYLGGLDAKRELLRREGAAVR